MRVDTVGRTCAMAAGVNAIAMGAYHFVLPSHMDWADAMESVPSMVQWGVYAINFDMSVLLMLIGTLSLFAAAVRRPQTTATVIFLIVPAAFWLAHQMYLRFEPMPIPMSLATLRATLEGFSILQLVLCCIALVAYLMDQHVAESTRMTWRARTSSVVIGLAPMACILIAIDISMPTLKPQDPAARQPAVSQKMIETAKTLADELGLADFSSLCPGIEPITLQTRRNIDAEVFRVAWPDLEAVLAVATEGMIEEALLEIEANESLPAAGALNLRAQLLRQQGESLAARAAIDAAIEAEPDEALHHWQSSLAYLDALRAATNGMQRWQYATKTQQAFERVLALNPDNRDARLFVATALQRAPEGFGGDRQRAMQLINDAVDSGDDTFYALRARFYQLAGDHEAGLRDAQLALAAGGYHADVFTSAARAALASGDVNRAEQFAAFAARMNPSDADAWAIAGDCFVERGHIEFARRAFESALALKPDDEVLKEKLASIGVVSADSQTPATIN